MAYEENNEYNDSTQEDREIVNSTFQNDSIKEQMDEFEAKTAGFWMRFWAFIFDQLIFTAVMGIAIYPIFTLMNWDLSDSALFAPITIISAIVYFGYFVLMTKFFQQTLGKMIFGLKVQSKHGEKLNWSTVLFREIIGRYINNKVPILYFFVIFMPKNLSLADYFSDTLVVYENAFVKKKKIPSIQQPIVNSQFSQTPNM